MLGVKKRIIKISALLMTAVTVTSGVLFVPGISDALLYTVKADPVQVTVNLGNAQKVGNIVTFPNASISGGDKVTSMSFSVSGGSIAGTGSSVYTNWTFTDILSAHKTATMAWTSNNGISLADAMTFLRGVQFNYAADMSVTVTVDANEMKLPTSANISVYEPVPGKGNHYYMYVNFPNYSSEGGGRYKDEGWKKAYSYAKTYVFMGMKGYLVTVTSAEEDKILDDISTVGAWAGGSRLSNGIGDSALDADTASGYYTAAGSNSTWKWVCGPEKGQLIYIDPRTRAAQYNVKGASSGYSYWCTDDYGVPNQPDGYDSTGEWNLQLHYTAQKRWNDLPETYDALIDGYYVEFSDYDGGRVESYSPLKTATVTAQHVHDWTYKTDVGNSAKVLAYCAADIPNVSLCPHGTEATAVTLTIAATGKNYDGAALPNSNITVTNGISSVTGATVSDYTFYKDAALTTPTGSDDGAVSSGKSPSKVGTYYVAITVTDATESSKKATASTSFTISKGTRPLDSVSVSMDGFIYGDTPGAPSVTGATEGATVEYHYSTSSTLSDSDPVWDPSNPPKCDAGTYYIYAKLGATESYDPFTSAPKEFTVAQKPITVNWTDDGYVYSGNAQGPTAEPDSSDVVSGDDVHFTVSGLGTDAGTHTATASLATTEYPDSANYVITSGGTKDYSIAKAPVEITPANQTIKLGKEYLKDFDAIRIQGVVNGEDPTTIFTVNPTVSCTSDEYRTTAGTYGLYIDPGCASKNYAVTRKQGVLTVQTSSSGTKLDDDPTSGEVITETVKEEGLPETSITSLTKEVAEELLNDTEKSKVSSGKDALIYLDLTKSEDVTDEIYDKISETVSKGYTLYVTETDLNDGKILDLSLYKKILGESTPAVKISELGTTEISVTVKLPDELINRNPEVMRSYEVIRYHVDSMGNKSFDQIPASNNGQYITFRTNKFSDYAISYKDTLVPKPPVPHGDDGKPLPSDSYMLQIAAKNAKAGANVVPVFGLSYKVMSPKTGDTMDIYFAIGLVALGAGVIVISVIKKRKERN